MLKKHFFIIITFVFISSCYAPKRDCKDYRTGTFSFEYEINGEKKKGKFVRGEKYSVDYFEGKIDSASIRWFNDCEFVLQDLNNKMGIHYKIVSTTDSSYTFEYKNAVKDPLKQLTVKTGTAIKID